VALHPPVTVVVQGQGELDPVAQSGRAIDF
jgi:hypothetical protein